MLVLYKDYVQVMDLNWKKKDTPIITEIEVTAIIHSLVRNKDSVIVIKEIPHVNILEWGITNSVTMSEIWIKTETKITLVTRVLAKDENLMTVTI